MPDTIERIMGLVAEYRQAGAFTSAKPDSSKLESTIRALVEERDRLREALVLAERALGRWGEWAHKNPHHDVSYHYGLSEARTALAATEKEPVDSR